MKEQNNYNISFEKWQRKRAWKKESALKETFYEKLFNFMNRSLKEKQSPIWRGNFVCSFDLKERFVNYC
jgi:hypothetical protein